MPETLALLVNKSKESTLMTSIQEENVGEVKKTAAGAEYIEMI
jgi:hypothetical protein